MLLEEMNKTDQKMILLAIQYFHYRNSINYKGVNSLQFSNLIRIEKIVG